MPILAYQYMLKDNNTGSINTNKYYRGILKVKHSLSALVMTPVGGISFIRQRFIKGPLSVVLALRIQGYIKLTILLGRLSQDML